MKFAGQRLRFGAAAFLTTMALGAVITPGIVSADSPQAAPSVEHHPATTKCYEQVTEYKYVKYTRYRTSTEVQGQWGSWTDWSAWTVWGTGDDHVTWSTQEAVTLGDPQAHGNGVEGNTRWERQWILHRHGGTRIVNGNEIPCDDTETKKVTLCHATGSASNPYEKITVSVNAFLNAGHISHGGDVYEAFSYVKQGQTHSVPARGDASLLQLVECVPQPEAKVEYGEWKDGVWECGDATITQTRTKTVTPFVLQGNKWVPGTPVVTTESQTRELTSAEVESCKPPVRGPEFTEWVDGEFECGDTEVIQTRTRTDYVWVLNAGSTWELTSSKFEETQTRALTEAEVESCQPPVRGPEFTEWVDGEFECGDTEVIQTRTRTDYVWVLNAGSTWELTSSKFEESADPCTDRS